MDYPARLTERFSTKIILTYLSTAILIALAMGPLLFEPFLLRPTNQLRALGLNYPGAPSLIYGPMMALLTVLCYGKTRWLPAFPLIGGARAAFAGFVLPANPAHLGSGLGGVCAGIVAAILLKDNERFNLRTSIPLLTGLYAGFQTAGNYLTTILLGSAAQQKIILTTPIPALGLIGATILAGTAVGLVAYRMLGALPPRLVKS